MQRDSIRVLSNYLTRLWSALLDWTDGLHYWTDLCSNHMSSIQLHVCGLLTALKLSDVDAVNDIGVL